MENLLLNNPFFKSPVLLFRELGSTMDEAKARGLNGASSGTVIISLFQTAGRGRGKGRCWIAEPGMSLLFTLMIRASDLAVPVHEVPVRTGMGICSVLAKKWKLDPRLKWPNDVLIESRKIAGILCECSDGQVRIGAGINVNQHEFAFFEDMKIMPTSIALCAGEVAHIDPGSLIGAFLEGLYAALYPAGGHDPEWIKDAERILYRRGETVSLREGDTGSSRVCRAVISGLTNEGALRLKDENGRAYSILSGEILY